MITLLRCIAVVPFALLCSCVSPPKADLVVAADGSGSFKTVRAAIDAAPANSEKRTVILVQSRNGADRPGYIFVDSRLTSMPDIARYVLARIDPARFPSSHVAFINCAMDQHILPAGWTFDGPGASSPKEHIRFEEFRSTDLADKPLDVSQRTAGSRQLTAAEAPELRDVARVFGGWHPAAAP